MLHSLLFHTKISLYPQKSILDHFQFHRLGGIFSDGSAFLKLDALLKCLSFKSITLSSKGSCRSFYKDYYDWRYSNYLICIKIGNVLFKTKYLPESC